MSKLVIVESPAKAKTISRILGPEYDVQASFGHVRDLPESADDIPAELKKQKWAKLGVNVEAGFEPLYVVPDSKKRHVDNLKKSSKNATELLLATDEDREGESISWHILQLLKPAKGKPVKRIVFHEITPEAILEAIRSPRDLDEDLVRAQETRRILDRLYGYTLSPLLWKKVAPKLSAGRVQSVAVRLCVERERERRAFVASEYWDLEAELKNGDGQFKAALKSIGGTPLASGRNFDPATGQLTGKAVLLDKAAAGDLKKKAETASPWKVTDLKKVPGQEKPPAPFMTSTLQQEAGRKLRYSAKRTMQIAQELYEGIDLGGERIGLITYMRTDSLSLAERALTEARDVIRKLYGPEYLPSSPVRYRTKSKNAQEAHEAIRPSSLERRPQDVKAYLDKDQLALYELIWKRTLACQMLPANVMRTQVEVTVPIDGKDHTFGASGKEITFPGFLRAYVEGSDDPDAELESKETILPVLNQGEALGLVGVSALEHHTKPPARYTEASLVKRLEEEGIGRPSTYASIIGTIQDRGYIFKKGTELVPTFTAFAVTSLLEDNFERLVDLKFTAKMEDELDDIAEGKRDWRKELEGFFNGPTGLAHKVEHESLDIPFPVVPLGDDPESGEPVVVRIGRTGAFIQRGAGGKGNTGNVPTGMPPAELTIEAALKLISTGSGGGEELNSLPDGRTVVLRSGRFGDFVEVEQSEEEKASGAKPPRASVPKGTNVHDLSAEELEMLLSFPRSLVSPDGEAMTIAIGPYGPYVKKDGDFRNVADWREAAQLTPEAASALFDVPKPGRGGRGSGEGKTQSAIQDFGQLEGAEGAVRVLAGRFGPYVTDGKTNATLPKGTAPESISSADALAILLKKKEAGPSARPKRGFKKKR